MFTLLGAVLVFLLGQFSLKLVIEPIAEHRKKIYKAAHCARIYADIFSNPRRSNEQLAAMTKEVLIGHEDAYEDMSRPESLYRSIRQETRDVAEDLIAGTSQLLPTYNTWSYCHLVPKLENIKEAHRILTRLSNSLMDETRSLANAEDLDKIDELLGIPKELRLSKINDSE